MGTGRRHLAWESVLNGLRTGRPQRNWSRTEACVPAATARPRDVSEVAALVARAADRGERVKVIGAGHSFTPIAMTSGTLISLDDLDRVREIDPLTGQVRVEAGIRLHRLTEVLAAAGWALPNLGDINTQSLAGAISTATHGTGRDLPNIGANVVAVEFVDGVGEVHRVTAGAGPGDGDDDLLRALRASLGALGVITEVTVQCVPAFTLRAVETVEPLADLLGEFEAFTRSGDHVEFFWMPGARRVRVKRNHRTDLPPAPPSQWATVRDKWIAENLAFGLVCRVGRRVPALAPVVGKVLTSSSGDREVIDRSDRIFSSPRWVRFVEMEYGIEREALPEALTRVGALAASLDFPPLFPIEVRVSAADDAPLSTGYGRPSAWIAVHQYVGAPYQSYFTGVERIMDDYAGRPHWGKLHFQTAETLASRYAQWDAFAAVRARCDPAGVFANPYLDRVLGPVRGS